VSSTTAVCGRHTRAALRRPRGPDVRRQARACAAGQGHCGRRLRVALRRPQGPACPVQVQQPVGTTAAGAHQLILVVAVQVEDKMSNGRYADFKVRYSNHSFVGVLCIVVNVQTSACIDAAKRNCLHFDKLVHRFRVQTIYKWRIKNLFFLPGVPNVYV
jgi:hypothetical protein